MSFDTPLEDSIEVTRKVLPLMREQRIPTIPENYAVWYRYAASEDPKLKAKIEGLVKAGQPFTPELCRSLYENHLVDPAIHTVRDHVRTLLSSVLGTVGNLEGGLGDYLEKLDACYESLGSEMSAAALKQVVADLAAETRTARENNASAESALKTVTAELEALRGEVRELARQSLTDDLTGIANRRAFDQELQRQLERVRAGETQCCLLLADVDHFKRFNDTHGHAKGDLALRLVAATMLQCVKGRDIVARYGGEEFAVILPETRLDGARVVAESIRALIASEYVMHAGERIDSVTLSLGAAELNRHDTANSVIERADAALYVSKEQGRNRVTLEADLASAAVH